MRRFEIDRRGGIVFERLFPARYANAPTIARFQSRKTPFRMRRDQIVSIKHGEIEKLARHFYANGVLTDIVRAGATITIAIKSSPRIAAAAL